MEGEGACQHKHCWGGDVLEGEVADELCLNDGANVCKIGTEVVYVADGGADGLARLLIRA